MNFQTAFAWLFVSVSLSAQAAFQVAPSDIMMSPRAFRVQSDGSVSFSKNVARGTSTPLRFDEVVAISDQFRATKWVWVGSDNAVSGDFPTVNFGPVRAALPAPVGLSCKYPQHIQTCAQSHVDSSGEKVCDTASLPLWQHPAFTAPGASAEYQDVYRNRDDGLCHNVYGDSFRAGDAGGPQFGKGQADVASAAYFLSRYDLAKLAIDGGCESIHRDGPFPNARGICFSENHTSAFADWLSRHPSSYYGLSIDKVLRNAGIQRFLAARLDQAQDQPPVGESFEDWSPFLAAYRRSGCGSKLPTVLSGCANKQGDCRRLCTSSFAYADYTVDLTADFYQRLNGRISDYGKQIGRGKIYHALNFAALSYSQGVLNRPTLKAFDGLVSEIDFACTGSSNAHATCDAGGLHVSIGRTLASIVGFRSVVEDLDVTFTLRSVKTLRESETLLAELKAFATGFATDTHLVMPWDVYMGTTQGRRYVDPALFATLTSFVAENRTLLDSAPTLLDHACRDGTTDCAAKGKFLKGKITLGGNVRDALATLKGSARSGTRQIQIVNFAQSAARVLVRVDRSMLPQGASSYALYRPGQATVTGIFNRNGDLFEAGVAVEDWAILQVQ